jgi:hypothetical protein
MTTVRPAHKARGARLTQLATTITRTIKIGSKNRYDGKYSLSVAEMHEEPDDVRAGSVSSRPQKFAGGFVDFLLGRGARYRR